MLRLTKWEGSSHIFCSWQERCQIDYRATVRNMNIQRLIVAQQQLSDELPHQLNTTIETDETSKFGHKYGAYAIRDHTGRPYVVGLRDLVTKSSKDTLDLVTKSLNQI